jgi:LPS sulfotransferase NodH
LNIFFIIGCARSGTSILGEIIASHPSVKYIFEAHDVWETAGKGENDSHRLTEVHVDQSVEKRLREWVETQIEQNKLLVEKNPRHTLRIPFIRRIFPEAKIIHIVRDGRDVACSMVPGCGGTEWNHLKPPGWQNFYAKYRGAIRCAHVWKEVVEIATKDLKGVDHLQIKYEELVESPLSTAKKVFEYLQLDLGPEVIEFCRVVSNHTENSYQAKIQNQWFTNNHRLRIGRWKENLTGIEKMRINLILYSTLRRLGYL